jgi:hypothetical protein
VTNFDIINQHDDRLAHLEDGFADIKAELAVCSERIATLCEKIDDLASKLDNLPHRLTALETVEADRVERKKTIRRGAIRATFAAIASIVVAFFATQFGINKP